ncbi:Protein of unknown function [Gryllus bimaculatus]|nr:Protein of unknown function [Gryllus bimaculatus]
MNEIQRIAVGERNGVSSDIADGWSARDTKPTVRQGGQGRDSATTGSGGRWHTNCSAHADKLINAIRNKNTARDLSTAVLKLISQLEMSALAEYETDK